MKKIFLVAAVLLAAACSKEEGENAKMQISESAKEALVGKYPQATDITWTTVNNYVVAGFNVPFSRTSTNVRMNAWFDNSGKWYMTESDVPFAELPNPVKVAFAASQYSQWTVDDVDRLERNGTEIIYVIEAEQAEQEIHLYYSPDGVLVKELLDLDDGKGDDDDGDDDYEDYIPGQVAQPILDYLQAHYPKARILEIEKEDNHTEVEILDETTKRELLFDANNTWICTKTKVSESEVPATVARAFADSEYGDYTIRHIKYYQTPDGDYFRYSLKSNKGNRKIDITLNGQLSVVEKGDSSDDHYAGALSKTVTDFIAKTYPGAKITESEYEKGYLEVEIFHADREKTVRFFAAGKWIDTSWEIRSNELPQAIVDILATSYAAYEIDDLEFFQSSAGDYYEIELENDDKELTLQIQADGTIL